METVSTQLHLGSPDSFVGVRVPSGSLTPSSAPGSTFIPSAVRRGVGSVTDPSCPLYGLRARCQLGLHHAQRVDAVPRVHVLLEGVEELAVGVVLLLSPAGPGFSHLQAPVDGEQWRENNKPVPGAFLGLPRNGIEFVQIMDV